MPAQYLESSGISPACDEGLEGLWSEGSCEAGALPLPFPPFFSPLLQMAAAEVTLVATGAHLRCVSSGGATSRPQVGHGEAGGGPLTRGLPLSASSITGAQILASFLKETSLFMYFFIIWSVLMISSLVALNSNLSLIMKGLHSNPTQI